MAKVQCWALSLLEIAVEVGFNQHHPVLQATGKDKKKDAKKQQEPGAAGDVEAASIEELHQKIHALEKEKNKEEECRNYMQLERVRSWL